MADLMGVEEEGGHKTGVMGFTVERVNALSDGVFAVAITLLVVSIAVPSIRGTVTEGKLAHGIGLLWPHYFAYVLSFIIVGMFWISHHSLFSIIRRVDKALIWMNILYLLLIVFVPYTANLLSLFGKTMVATVMYAAVLGAAGLFQAGMAFYAVRGRRLVDDEFEMEQAGQYMRHSLAMTVIFLISIGIAFASPTIAQMSWILLFFTPLLERVKFNKKPGKPDSEAQAVA